MSGLDWIILNMGIMAGLCNGPCIELDTAPKCEDVQCVRYSRGEALPCEKTSNAYAHWKTTREACGLPVEEEK